MGHQARHAGRDLARCTERSDTESSARGGPDDRPLLSGSPDVTGVAAPIRADRAHTAPRLFAVLALGLLLQPVILAFASGHDGSRVAPTHQHTSVSSMPEHYRSYGTGTDRSDIPPGCGGAHHDHQQRGGTTMAAVTCVPGDHIAGETITAPMLGAANLLMLLGVTEQQVLPSGWAMFGSWSVPPTTPPPQSAL